MLEMKAQDVAMYHVTFMPIHDDGCTFEYLSLLCFSGTTVSVILLFLCLRNNYNGNYVPQIAGFFICCLSIIGYNQWPTFPPTYIRNQVKLPISNLTCCAIKQPLRIYIPCIKYEKWTKWEQKGMNDRNYVAMHA